MSHRLFAAFTLGLVSLSACSGGNNDEERAVAMRDMEVVDGTASDAMTDLDGVQTEGIALPPAPGATPPPAASSTSNSTAETEDSSEADVVSDQ